MPTFIAHVSRDEIKEIDMPNIMSDTRNINYDNCNKIKSYLKEINFAFGKPRVVVVWEYPSVVTWNEMKNLRHFTS